MRQEQIAQRKAFLVQCISEDRRDVVGLTAQEFGVTRQAIYGDLSKLIADGAIRACGRTKARTYALRPLAQRHVEFSIESRPAEDRAWRNTVSSIVSSLPRNVIDICQYGFTEMFNNAVEHSLGHTITVQLVLTAAAVEIRILDDGIGIFKKIKDGLHLADEREAILELAKGKVTTDPATHSGEGIFFTSRMFDEFSILSGRLFFQHGILDTDWLMEHTRTIEYGTAIVMKTSAFSKRVMREVFDKYTSELDRPTFDKTHVPVSLLRVGEENLVSRSQAKRLLSRFNRFKEVMLDFTGVEDIGQAFADEIFRVFKNQNPDVRIVPLGANDRVQKMIQRALHSDEK